MVVITINKFIDFIYIQLFTGMFILYNISYKPE